MNANPTTFEATAGKTRHDTLAASVVLVAIIATSLCGLFAADAGSPVPRAGERPAQYAALEDTP